MNIIKIISIGAHAAIIVYDITKKESFESLKQWISELKKNAPKKISKQTNYFEKKKNFYKK